MGKFVIKTTKAGISFVLKAGNGEIICRSEVYNSKAACETVEGFTKEKHPKFEIFADKRGEFRFRLKATNGEVIAASEGYKSLSGCQNGIESVRKNAPDAEIVRLEPETD